MTTASAHVFLYRICVIRFYLDHFHRIVLVLKYIFMTRYKFRLDGLDGNKKRVFFEKARFQGENLIHDGMTMMFFLSVFLLNRSRQHLRVETILVIITIAFSFTFMDIFMTTKIEMCV